MYPILFNENATTYDTNGIGRLSDAIYCQVEEERNGIYELEMRYPMTGIHYADIGIRKIICAKPSANSTIQAFRIYKISRPINGVITIYAQHISYDLSKNTTMPFSVAASGLACDTVLQALAINAVEACPFTFWTDVTTVASYSQLIPASIRQRLGGVEGSVLDQFGGEFEWDNFTVKLHRTRGSERNITLRYGKNITDIKQEENIASTLTGVVPYWINAEGSESVTLPEKAVYSQYASRYSTHLTAPLDMSSQWENKPTEAQLRTAAQVYVNKAGFGLPKVSINVSFIDLAKTEEYKDVLPLQEVSLCDTVKVQFETLGIDTTAEIVKTEYDVLKEEYISVVIGELRSNFSSTVNDIDNDLSKAISSTGRTIFAQVNSSAQDVVNNATAWLTGSNGYVVAHKNADGTWKELLFMDHASEEQAINVLRINENGIGFSRNGVGGPYENAWTIDGTLIADFITTGIISGHNGRNYFDLDNDSFVISADSTNVNYPDATYQGAYKPTTGNTPASGWDASARAANVGETFYDNHGKKTYVWDNQCWIESEHDYASNIDEYYFLNVSNRGIGTRAKITFDPRSVTESASWDWIDFIDTSENTMLRIGGTFPESVVVPVRNNSIPMRWRTDGSVVKWGWKILSITPTDDAYTEGRTAWTSAAISGQSYDGYGWKELSLDEYVAGIVKNEVEVPQYTQEQIFNILTNNGQTQGIFLQNGKLYLNGEYLGAGQISIGGSTYSSNPTLQIKDSGNNVIGKWTKDGIEANKGKFGIFTIDGTNSTIYVPSSRYYLLGRTEIDLYCKTKNKYVTFNPRLDGYDTDVTIYFKVEFSEGEYNDSGEWIAEAHSESWRGYSFTVYLQRRYGFEGSWSTITQYSITNNQNHEYTSYFSGIDHNFGDGGNLLRLKFRFLGGSTRETGTVSISAWTDNLTRPKISKQGIYGSFVGSLTGSAELRNLSFGVFQYDEDTKSLFAGDESDDSITLGKNGGSHYSLRRTYNGNSMGVEWSSSDRRIKRYIKDLPQELSLRLIDQTMPKSFTYKRTPGKHYGMIAQEAREVLDSLGETDAQLEHSMEVPDEETGMDDQRTIDYHEYIPHLINYVKHLQEEIEQLKRRTENDNTNL